MAMQRVASYFEHLMKARTRHAVHSPFVYDLIEKVLRPTQALPEFEGIEALRADLLRSDQTIRVNDLGAGSRKLDLPVRRVSDIARYALKPAREAQLLFRLARYLDAKEVLELGTSFGLTTLYLAKGAEEGRVRTIEGCPQIHRIALHHFEQARQRNIAAQLGSFARLLPETLRNQGPADLYYLDGHHAEAPTVSYFEQCIRTAEDGAVFVVDDIHWSSGMERAWDRIKAHPRITVSIDLYGMGLAFVRPEQAEEHFRLRY
jgi:predicted O-methyltransferase YrrM